MLTRNASFRLGFGLCRCRGGAALGRFRVFNDRDLWIFEFDAGLAVEYRTAFRERGRLVCLLGHLALGVRFWGWSAVLD